MANIMTDRHLSYIILALDADYGDVLLTVCALQKVTISDHSGCLVLWKEHGTWSQYLTFQGHWQAPSPLWARLLIWELEVNSLAGARLQNSGIVLTRRAEWPHMHSPHLISAWRPLKHLLAPSWPCMGAAPDVCTDQLAPLWWKPWGQGGSVLHTHLCLLTGPQAHTWLQSRHLRKDGAHSNSQLSIANYFYE